MDKKYQSLIRLLSLGELSRGEFIAQYFENKAPNVAFFTKALDDHIQEKNGEAVEKDLALIAILGVDESVFIKQLCELLQEDWHCCHEDVAMSIKEIKSPLTVDCLYRASEKQFEYLDYDDTFQFARKCIKALSSIGDENAIDKLRLLKKSKTPQIAAYALKELGYKGFL